MKVSVNYVKSGYSNEKKTQDSGYTFYFKYIMRPLSFYGAIPFIILGFSATQVTIFSLLFGVVGNVFFTIGTFNYSFLAICLINISILLDFVDGNIARYNNQSSQYGKFIDGVSGQLIYSLLPICISIGFLKSLSNYNHSFLNGFQALILGSFASIFHTFIAYLMWRFKAQINETKIIADQLKNKSEKDSKVNTRKTFSLKNKIQKLVFRFRKFLGSLMIPSLFLVLFDMSDFLILYLFSFSIFDLFLQAIKINLNAFRKLS